MTPEYWSGTRQGMIDKCGEQYRRRYGLGEKLPPAIVMVRGSAVHVANEANMLAKMDGGGISVEEARDIAASSFDERVSAGYVIDGTYAKEKWEPKAAVGHCRDDAVHLAALHVEEVAPTIEPTATEVRIEVQPSDAIPVPFVSILDVIDRGKRPVDTKTKSKAPAERDADVSQQLSGQALAFRAYYGEAEEWLRLDVLVRTPKTRKAKNYPLKTTRTADDLAVFVRRVRTAISSVEAEIFLPAPADHWVCNPLWCGYYETCPYARGRSRPSS